jgi:hypothetical protein
MFLDDLKTRIGKLFVSYEMNETREDLVNYFHTLLTSIRFE